MVFGGLLVYVSSCEKTDRGLVLWLSLCQFLFLVRGVEFACQQLVRPTEGAVMCGLCTSLVYFRGDVGFEVWAEMCWKTSS